jgi:uncharacterized protein YbjT (DUF2867 family)
VVTGATGTVGRRVVRELAARHAVRAVTRDPAGAVRAGLSCRLVEADFADHRRLRGASAGADALLLITSDPLRPEHDENVVAAARAQGVRHIVKLSALAVADPDAQDLITCWQRGCEALVRASGAEWTLLRPRAFMSNALGWARSVREEGVVRARYGESRNACVDPADIAAVAARVLTSPGHAGRSYALTGPRPLSAREQTEVLAAVLQRPLSFEELPTGRAWEAWRARFPEPVARAVAESAERQRAGAKEAVADGVRQVLGREPRGFDTWAAEHADHFR